MKYSKFSIEQLYALLKRETDFEKRKAILLEIRRKKSKECMYDSDEYTYLNEEVLWLNYILLIVLNV